MTLRGLTARIAVAAMIIASIGTHSPAVSAVETDCDYARAGVSLEELPWPGSGAWSPDGTEIAFLRDGQILVWDVAGRRVDRCVLCDGDAVNAVRQWSTDGRIFFVRGGAGGAGVGGTAFGGLGVVDADGSNAREIDTAALPPREGMVQYGQPHFHKDGRRAVFNYIDFGAVVDGTPTHGWRQVLTDIEETADGDLQMAAVEILNSDPYFNEAKGWSGDGTKIVFSSSRGEEGDRRSLNADVFVRDVESREVSRLTRAPTWEEAADVLRGDLGPGDAVTFISDRDTPNPFGVGYGLSDRRPNDFDSVLVALAVAPLVLWTSHELFVAGHQGDRGWVRRITFDYQDGWVARIPKWSPDGNRILFTQWSRHGGSPMGHRTMLATFACDMP